MRLLLSRSVSTLGTLRAAFREYKEGTLRGCKVPLNAHYWHPSDKPRAAVMLMHGYAEHLRWYHDVGVGLANEGFLAFGHDHIGHGRSGGDKVIIEDVEHMVDDVMIHAQAIRDHYPEVPLFFVGHSMGGLVAFLSAMRSPPQLKGVVLNGPFLMLGKDVRSPIRKFAARTLCKILPSLQVGKLKMDHVTGDKEMIEVIMKDPLWWTGGVKLKTGTALLNSVEKVHEKFPLFDVPFLIIHGATDKICDVEGSQDLLKQSPSKDKQIKLYEGAEHHLYIDKKPVREAAIRDTVQWVCERV
ncbi:monoglyceride lipase-like isoform X2 [Neocloeon triangulifer]|uniref:monoglyceride lipase-like isoform X2 n=1 Tax=Neocloeon triangulifer TaxID=2078957 RepID=UPI00286ECD63|nr:monoglyceride lipase-like isoform X2 [Neocloeon triangulifer]